MTMESLLWLVPVLPALGALVNGLRAARRPREPKNRTVTNAVALGSTALSALLATAAVLRFAAAGIERPLEAAYFQWVPAGLVDLAGGGAASVVINFGLRVDSLSAVMMMVVCWVGFVIHVYSTGYMAHETGYTRYFTYLNLFMFMMLLLVMGSNYGVMFVGWEGVGLCSYLLIGFYYDKKFAADAGKKAFLVNRIGDFGFILGILLMLVTFGTAEYSQLFPAIAANPSAAAGVSTAICLLLFVGACGKSAQLPLYVWLPDAMAGPTPVSALIHAATMVTAGVYMVVRSSPLFRLSPTAMMVVALVGALTAIFAATIAVAQNDIKKVLAYSTVSQLGFMFLAAGVGAFAAAIFHLMTHAFFKACLFLGAGSVIHACNGEQDMRRMGGLRRYLPKTWITFLIASLAIAGIPPLAGFFSKDEILTQAFLYRFATLGTPWRYVPLFGWILGVLAATLTAFYMFRLYFMTFEGSYRGAVAAGLEVSEPEHKGHEVIADTTPLYPPDEPKGQSLHAGGHAKEPHESPLSMTVPLMILAGLAIVGGFVGVPLGAFGIERANAFHRWLEPVLSAGAHGVEHGHHPGLGVEWTLILISVAVAVAGILVARRFYQGPKAGRIPRSLAESFPNVYRWVEGRYFVDELYHATAVAGTLALARLMSWIDQNVIDGLVNLSRHVTVILFGSGSNLFDRYVIDGAVNGVAESARRGSLILRRWQTGVVQSYALTMGGGLVVLLVVYLVTRA